MTAPPGVSAPVRRAAGMDDGRGQLGDLAARWERLPGRPKLKPRSLSLVY
ncbi:MAG TPA: hypothetical protein PLN41_01655 [Methanothrix sp.]|nr:hypothetical protein [Methanothrix sp.]